MPKSKAAKATGEPPKRLSPTPESLRELYLLSGNKCAMPGCTNLLIDGNGVVVGHICHIRAALSDGARFDASMDNEARRHVSNLLMLCGGHHKQIDSKQYEKQYTLPKVLKIKREHEAKFKGVGDSLQRAFEHGYADVTDALAPTEPVTFAKFERLIRNSRVDAEQAEERRSQVADYIRRMRLVPDAERAFMLAVIRRAAKLAIQYGVTVPTDDLRSSIGIPNTKLDRMGKALRRYAVGDLDLSGTASGEDEYCVSLRDPSEYVGWAELVQFCDAGGVLLDDLVLRLKFGLLDD